MIQAYKAAMGQVGLWSATTKKPLFSSTHIACPSSIYCEASSLSWQRDDLDVFLSRTSDLDVFLSRTSEFSGHSDNKISSNHSKQQKQSHLRN